MDLFNQFGIDIGYVVIGMAGVIFLLFILLVITMVKNKSIRKKYVKFMDGENGKNLEKAILDKFSEIDILKEDVKRINAQLDNIDGRLIHAYQKIGIVKYDAFKEIGGKLSFVLVLLTAQNNGFILNSMHSTREGCYTYSKEVVNGEAFVILSDEEQQALDEAKANKGLSSLVKENEIANRK